MLLPVAWGTATWKLHLKIVHLRSSWTPVSVVGSGLQGCVRPLVVVNSQGSAFPSTLIRQTCFFAFLFNTGVSFSFTFTLESKDLVISTYSASPLGFPVCGDRRALLPVSGAQCSRQTGGSRPPEFRELGGAHCPLETSSHCPLHIPHSLT